MGKGTNFSGQPGVKIGCKLLHEASRWVLTQNFRAANAINACIIIAESRENSLMDQILHMIICKINDMALLKGINFLKKLHESHDRWSEQQKQSLTKRGIYFFFLLFSIAFFSSLASLRSTFFTSSAAGRSSGTMSRSNNMRRTAALLSICSLAIIVSLFRSLV